MKLPMLETAHWINVKATLKNSHNPWINQAKLMKSVRNVLPLLALWWLASLPLCLSANPVWEQVIAKIKPDEPQCIEDLWSKLPPEMYNQFALLPFSRGLQKTSVTKPRVIVTDRLGMVYLTFSSRSLFKPSNTSKYFSAEAAVLDLETQAFKPFLIVEKESKGRKSLQVKNDRDSIQVCKSCHGSPFRLIYDDYPGWPDAFGNTHNTFYGDIIHKGAKVPITKKFLFDSQVEIRNRELENYRTFWKVTKTSWRGVPTTQYPYSNLNLPRPNWEGLHRLSTANTAISFQAGIRNLQSGLTEALELVSEYTRQSSVSPKRARAIFKFILTGLLDMKKHEFLRDFSSVYDWLIPFKLNPDEYKLAEDLWRKTQTVKSSTRWVGEDLSSVNRSKFSRFYHAAGHTYTQFVTYDLPRSVIDLSRTRSLSPFDYEFRMLSLMGGLGVNIANLTPNRISLRYFSEKSEWPPNRRWWESRKKREKLTLQPSEYNILNFGGPEHLKSLLKQIIDSMIDDEGQVRSSKDYRHPVFDTEKARYILLTSY